MTNVWSVVSPSTGDSSRTKTSSPFLRKPLPDLRAELGDGPSEDDDSGGSNKGVPRKNSSRIHYDAIPTDENSHDVLTRQSSGVSNTLERHLTLGDLIALGIGSTVGSGIFVLAGLVANQYAGPATVVSWLISGFTALLSACCYAELSGRIPLAGGAYAYNYVAMGELCAVLTAACLSIEYVAAAAAVSRSWGDKCVLWLTEELPDTPWLNSFDIHASFNPLALVLSTATVGLLLCGVKESKAATNWFTGLKVVVVTVMVFGALCYVKPSNWTPFAPYGVGGIVRGGKSPTWSLQSSNRATLTSDAYGCVLSLKPREHFLATWDMIRSRPWQVRPRTPNAISRWPSFVSWSL